MEREELKKFVDKNYSINDISKEFNLSYTSIRYYLNKYGLKTNGYKTEHDWSKSNLEKAMINCNCKSDVLRNLNVTLKSGNFQTLDRYIKKYDLNNIDLKYKNDRGNRIIEKYGNDDVFCIHSPLSTGKIKNRIIKYNLIEYKCAKCKLNDIWNGEKLILQLDHINGINDDNRLSNLRFLCPNCHSQTLTYCRKKQKI